MYRERERKYYVYTYVHPACRRPREAQRASAASGGSAGAGHVMTDCVKPAAEWYPTGAWSRTPPRPLGDARCLFV